MQISCHYHEISSILYNFSAYNAILVGLNDTVIISIIAIITLMIYRDMKF